VEEFACKSDRHQVAQLQVLDEAEHHFPVSPMLCQSCNQVPVDLVVPQHTSDVVRDKYTFATNPVMCPPAPAAISRSRKPPCMDDHSRKIGSFLLASKIGVEVPYRLIEGNLETPWVGDGHDCTARPTPNLHPR